MLLIGNGRLVTRDNGLFIENGAVVTDGNHILDVGETDALRARYPQAEFIDANAG
jgi:cytosine/adenosine deaminase-related metal-dependent hydrolase